MKKVIDIHYFMHNVTTGISLLGWLISVITVLENHRPPTFPLYDFVTYGALK